MSAENDTLIQPFFFVNKTPKSASLSHGKADEAFYIQSYVQSRVRKQKRQAKHAHNGHEACVFPEPGAAKISEQNVTPQAIPSLQPSRRKGLVKSLSGPAPQREDIQDRPRRQPQRIQENQNLPPDLSSLQTEKGIILDEKTYSLLQYPLSNFIVTNFAAESLSLLSKPVVSRARPFRHNDAVIRKLQRCIEDDMVMYAALANSTSCIRWAVGDEMEGFAPEGFMLKTLTALKRRLSSSSPSSSSTSEETWLGNQELTFTQGIPLDPWCLICIHDIGVADLWSRDLDAAAAHMRMISHLLADQLGSRMDVLDPYTLENLILADKYLALARGEPPILRSEWFSLPEDMLGPSIDLVDEKLNIMGKAFAGLRRYLSADLRQLISETMGCIKAAHTIDLLPETEHLLFLRHQSLIYRLLLVQQSSPFLIKSYDRLNEACRLGLLMWLLKITSSLQAERAAKNLLPRLREALEEADKHLVDDWHVRALLLWVTTVGARIAEFMDERDWFVLHAAELGEQIGLPPEKEDYSRFLREYFYLEIEEGLQFKRMVLVIRNKRRKE